MIAFRVVELEEISSTNHEVKRALQLGEPEGLVVCAQRQTNGYGRQGRAWSSLSGGLYCSWLLRPSVATQNLSTLSLITAIAARRAVLHFAPQLKNEIKIKWPNDVIVDFTSTSKMQIIQKDVCDGAAQSFLSKVCGISLETHAGGVCVGVGVNVVPPDVRPYVGGKNIPVYMVEIAPNLADIPSTDVVSVVFSMFKEEFSSAYSQWLQDGFAAFASEYNACLALRGRPISIKDIQGTVLAAGEVERVDTQGCLVLRTAQNKEIAVASGEVCL